MALVFSLGGRPESCLFGSQLLGGGEYRLRLICCGADLHPHLLFLIHTVGLQSLNLSVCLFFSFKLQAN